MVLGEASPVIGAVKAFINEEPFNVRSISVTLTTEVSSVETMLLYDDAATFLGRARLDPSASTNRTYKLLLASEDFVVPQRTERKVYARAELKKRENGGVSNETVQISSFTMVGTGIWSGDAYTKASTDTFLSFKTSRGKIVRVKNAGLTNSSLIFGTQRQIGSYEFAARTTDSSAHVDLTRLTFRIDQTGGVQLANVKLAANGISEKFDCTASSTLVTCSSIPEPYGTLTNEARQLSLYADVSVSPSSTNASLRLSLVEPGSISEAGSISWYDGTTTFDWTGFEGPTVVEGTNWKY